jgi:hypothetical protein
MEGGLGNGRGMENAGMSPGCIENRLFFVISSHKIIGSLVYLYQYVWVWLGCIILQ